MIRSMDKAVLDAAGAENATRRSVIDAGLGVPHSTRYEVVKAVDDALQHGLLWKGHDQLEATAIRLTRQGRAAKGCNGLGNAKRDEPM